MTNPMATQVDRPRVSSGMEAFDDQTGGGFPQGEFCLVCGGADAGKTILCLQFAMEGLKKEERVAWVSSIHPEELLARGEALGLPVGDYLRTNQFILLQQKTQASSIIRDEHELGELLKALEDEIAGWEPTRLVIDSALPFIDLIHPDFRKAAFATIVRDLIKLGTTMVWTTRMPASGEAMILRKNLEDLSGCALHLDEHLRPDGSSSRRLVVRKMSGLKAPYPVFEFGIEEGEGLVPELREGVGLESPKEAVRAASERKTGGDTRSGRSESLLFTKHGANAKAVEKARKEPVATRSAQSREGEDQQEREKKRGSKGFSFKSTGGSGSGERDD